MIKVSEINKFFNYKVFILFLIINLLILILHFNFTERDLKIDHSREVSFVSSIDAFNNKLPFHTTNKHVNEGLCNLQKKVGNINSIKFYCSDEIMNQEKFVPIDMTWEDPGNFYFIYYFGTLKKLITKENFVIEDLFYLEVLMNIFLIIIVLNILFKNKSVNFFLTPIIFFLYFFLPYKDIIFTYNILTYWTYITIVPLILSLPFIFDNNKNIFMICIVSFFASIIYMVRSDAGYILFVILLSFIIFYQKFNYNVIIKLFLAVLLFVIPQKIPEYHKNKFFNKNNIEVEKLDKYISQHPIWMSLYTGLGYPKNEIYNFKAGREPEAIKAVNKRYGNLIYQTEEFDNAIRSLIIEDIKKNPKIFLFIYKTKIKDLLNQTNMWKPHIKNWYFVSFLIFIFCMAKIYNEYRFFWLIVFSMILLSAPPIIREPYSPYDVPFKLYIFLFFLFFNRVNKKMTNNI